MPNYVLEQERHYYEQSELWTKPLDRANANRVLTTLRHIPDDVASILDVGCGKGVVTNRLLGSRFVAGLDLSATALGYLNPGLGRLQGSALRLPFQDGAFDLVLASEVVEHFPDTQQRMILDELRRVSKRYLLIGVPAEEDVAAGRVPCGACGEIFHPSHHQRSYDRDAMIELTGWRPISILTSGGVRASVHPLLRLLGRRVGGTFESANGTCPKCGNPYGVSPAPLPSLALKSVNLAWRRLTGRHKHKSHWVALYRQDPGEPTFANSQALADSAATAMAGERLVFVIGAASADPAIAHRSVVVASPGWRVHKWPGLLLQAIRSQAGEYVASDLPGRLLAKTAAAIRGAKFRNAHRNQAS